MKKQLISRLCACLMVALCGMPLMAQGVIVYQKDGKMVKFPYEQIDSIVTYNDDVEDEPVTPPVTPPEIAYEAVDLGLSVKWASFNVGATSPEEYGDYFFWGGISPERSFTSANCFTYDKTIEELKYSGIIGSDENLTTAFDAATANWGDAWRMPTSDEMGELINNCTWEWDSIIVKIDAVQLDTIRGSKVTGPNGNSIFLPTAGSKYRTTLSNAGSIGHYWSATPTEKSALYLKLSKNGPEMEEQRTHLGYTVRPVSE